MKKTKVGGIDLTKRYLCMECSCQRDPIWVKRGWLIIEIMLWLLYIFPGVIYSIWRRVRKQQVCPNCRNPTIVLTTSSRVMKARQLMSTVSGNVPLAGGSPIPAPKNPVKPSSSPALDELTTSNEKNATPVSPKKAEPFGLSLDQLIKISANPKPTEPPGPPASKTGEPRKNYQDVLKSSQRRGKIAKGQQGPIHFKLPENKKNKE